MPTEASIPITKILANNPVVYIERIQGLDGGYIKQADVSAIAFTVYDLDNSSAVVTTGSFAVSSVIYDSVQTGQIWVEDNIGYNFKVTLPPACFPLASRRYRVVFSFTTVSWGVIQEAAEYHTISITGA